MPNTLEPEVVKSAKEEKPIKRRRPQIRFKVRSLPPAVHRELDERFASRNYRNLGELSEWLETEHGQVISPSSLAYYFRHDLDPTLQAVKMATMQAAEIVRLTGGAEDEMSHALLRLTQTAIFDLLVQLNRSRHLIEMLPAERRRSSAIRETRKRNRVEDGASETAVVTEASESSPPSRLEVAAVTALGKTVAMVGKAVIDLSKWRDQMREKLEQKVVATSAKVLDAAREGGLSPEVEQSIRDALMEIKL